jgi:hypothetical protein
MDSRTINGSYTYFPDHWGTYRLLYAARIRLIDALTGNGGAWVKAKLKSYADTCVSEFGASSLELPQVTHPTATSQPAAGAAD